MKLRSLAARIRKPEGLLVLLFILSLPLVTPYLRGDGVGYYAWLSSPVIDHDLQFENQYLHGDPTFVANNFYPDGSPRTYLLTSTGHMQNQWSVGPAVLWSPFFLAADALVHVSPVVGLHFGTDGYSLPFLWLTGIGSALYAFIGLFLSSKVARTFAAPWAAFFGALAVWGASSLPVYQYFLPFWPFACGVLVAGILLWYWHRSTGWGWKRWLLIGLLNGVLISIHPIGVAWIALPLVALARLDGDSWTENVRARAKAAAVFAGGVILGDVPELTGKWIVHGSPLKSGYIASWAFLHPHFLRALVGAEHGLISWTPIAGISLIGLWWVYRHADKRLAVGLTTVFLVMLYVIASYATAEQSSFGNRFFVLFIPGFVVGAAGVTQALWERRRVVVVVGVAVLIAWNALFAFQWAWGLTPKRGPVNWATVVRNQFTTAPRELAHALVLFVTNRQELIRIVQQKDLEQIQSGTDVSVGG